MQNKRILVTGAAGFIGSNMVEELRKNNSVVGIDNLSNTDTRFVEPFLKDGSLTFHKMDILDLDSLMSLEPVDLVIHFAANSDVRGGSDNPQFDFDVNAHGTLNVLEFMRKKDVPEMIFASSSTVYGEPSQLPTPENYGPYMPISTYGASKMAGEGFITAYSHYYGFRASIFRFANIVGRNSTHGVIFDFIRKLMKNKTELEILGDGTQRKSYMHVTDCVGSILFLHERIVNTDIFNLGNESTTSVVRIADEVVKQMGLKGVRYRFTGGIDGRGWKGDVKIAQLAIDKMISHGWKNKYSSDEAISIAVGEVLHQIRR